MMGKNNISQFKLELYHLDLATPKERKQIEATLNSDAELRRRYEALVDSDKEIRRRYPYSPNNMPVPPVFRDVRKPDFKRGAPVRGQLSKRKRLLIGFSAAAVLVCVLFFSVINKRNQNKENKGPTEIAFAPDPDNEIGRARATENRELSIFISGKEGRIPDGTLLRAGDYFQLFYTTPPEGEYEGVIFAVDGRPGSDVTLLYGHDSPKLGSGRQSLEWYELDAAPDFEMFFLVASKNHLDAEEIESIIKTANEAATADLSAGEPGRDLKTVQDKMYSAFEGYEVRHSYITK